MSAKNILVVEDDLEMRDMLIVLLEGQKYQVTVARSGEAALDQIDRQVPDLVLLDLMLPSLTGWDVLRQVRATHPFLAVIMLTGRSEAVDKVVGLELGADDYVVKPFNPRELLARIGAVLRRARRAESEVPAEVVKDKDKDKGLDLSSLSRPGTRRRKSS